MSQVHVAQQTSISDMSQSDIHIHRRLPTDRGHHLFRGTLTLSFKELTIQLPRIQTVLYLFS